MVVPVLSAPTRLDESAERWSPIRRFAFRVLAVYLALYLIDGWLLRVPGLAWLGGWYFRAVQNLIVWTGTRVMQISSEIDLHRLGTGSGDTLVSYLQVLCTLAVAGVAAAAASIVDGKRLAYPIAREWLRVYVRYSLAAIMLSYGMAKVFPGQFGALTLDRYMETYGQSSPMGVLWTFMGSSRPYTFFCGAVETIGGLLLFWQRTTALGALTVAASMFNVVLLNFSYDVPVKLYSSHLFLLAAFLLLPDLRRLASFFLFNEPAPATILRTPFSSVWRHRAALAAKYAVIGIVLWQTTAPQVLAVQGPRPPLPPRYGVYDVETFMLNGSPREAAPADPKRWRRVIINERSAISIQTMDEAMVRYRTKEDATKRTYELSTIFNPYEKTVLTYNDQLPDRLILEGSYAGVAIVAHLRLVPMPSFLLVSRGFHWISEYPYNR